MTIGRLLRSRPRSRSSAAAGAASAAAAAAPGRGAAWPPRSLGAAVVDAPVANTENRRRTWSLSHDGQVRATSTAASIERRCSKRCSQPSTRIRRWPRREDTGGNAIMRCRRAASSVPPCGVRSPPPKPSSAPEPGQVACRDAIARAGDAHGRHCSALDQHGRRDRDEAVLELAVARRVAAPPHVVERRPHRIGGGDRALGQGFEPVSEQGSRVRASLHATSTFPLELACTGLRLPTQLAITTVCAG